MVKLTNTDLRIIDTAFQADPGYVMDFSNRTFSDFFIDELNIDIDDQKYFVGGTSKLRRLKTFLDLSHPAQAGKALRKLWAYREGLPKPPAEVTKRNLFQLIDKIEGNATIASTDAIERFVHDETLEELVGSIERDINADKPVAALDRLHTYCNKKFGHLLDERGVNWDKKEPLNSRVGKYVKSLEADMPLKNMTLQILKNAIGVFDKFNDVRNNQSLAHDNEVIGKAEARFIFDSVSAILRFIKTVDMKRFE